MTLPLILDTLTAYAAEIGAAAAILAVLATLLVWLFRAPSLRLPGSRPDIAPVETVAKYRDKAIALAAEMQATPGLLDVWSLKQPEDTVPEARMLMKRTFSLYHEVWMHRQAGHYPDADWAAAKAEMKGFLAFHYVKHNIAFADTLSAPFGAFMRDLERSP